MNYSFKYELLQGGLVPHKGSDGAIGWDLGVRIIFKPKSAQRAHCVLHDFSIHGPQFVLEPQAEIKIGIGFNIELRRNTAAYVQPRSSTIERRLEVLNAAVPIDHDFRGEPVGHLYNRGDESFTIEHGMRLVQLCVVEVVVDEPKKVGALSKTGRGKGWNGSTNEKHQMGQLVS